VIFGVLLIDSCTLNIPEGTQVYFHGDLANNDIGVYREGFLITLANGRLQVDGTIDNPVIFQGDRLESAFEDEPGQWPGLRLGANSRGNVFRNAVIKNSIVGIRLDSMAEVLLENVEISNTSSSGLLSIHADVNAVNTLIYDNGQNGIQSVFGGNLSLDYCTIASYGNNGEAVSLNNFFCYDPPFCGRVNINLLRATFTNCLITGNENDEINLFDASDNSDMLDYTFDHCLVRVRDLLDDLRFPDFFDNCPSCLELLSNNNPLFISINNDDYHLDSLTVVRDAALPISVMFDKENNSRNPITPDIGCFEFQ
jgi:hypothetical protein